MRAAHPKYADIIKDDKHLKLLLDLLATNNFRSILDIGTGTGYLAFPLAEMFPDAKVYGIDIADTIIEKNRNVAAERGMRNLEFRTFDGLQYPFEDESFDLIVSRYAFHHFPDTTEADRQLYDIVNENDIIWVGHINVGNTIFIKKSIPVM